MNPPRNRKSEHGHPSPHSRRARVSIPTVAECLEIPVITQGATLDVVSANLREAVALHLEGENLAEIGLAACPSIIVTFELETSPAPA